MGVGAEEDNDKQLQMALGDDGDIEAEVADMTEEAVEEAGEHLISHRGLSELFGNMWLPLRGIVCE